MDPIQSRYGPWAVVTGASAGIGKHLALEAARHGLNVVLVARDENRLRDLADGLRLRFGVDAETLSLDLADPSAAEMLDTRTRHLDVGLLVNNAGVEQRGSFVRHAPEDVRRASTLNVTTPTELARRFGSRFLDRGRGGIVFVAGIIGHQGVPHLAHYAATKAHQLTLAESLHYELRPHGVDVLGLSPGLTTTPMVGRLGRDIRFGRIGMLALRPARVARAAFKHLGRRPSVVVGLQARIFTLLSKRILSRARGAWLFGTLFRFAFADKSLLDPRPSSMPRRGTRTRNARTRRLRARRAATAARR